MSVFFPRYNEFSPLFRLADEIDRATRHVGAHQSHQRSFSPRFDVKETKEAYELHGELPGIEQSNVNIEWSDESTLTISGHTEHRYEKSPASTPEVVEAEESEKYHKPTVEDEASPAEKPADTAVTKTEGEKSVSKAESKPRFWVTERSVGSFHRTFKFPTRVDQDGVEASLKNGILSITVPKAKAREPRKVTIA